MFTYLLHIMEGPRGYSSDHSAEGYTRSHTFCVSWKALVRRRTRWWMAPCSRNGAWFAWQRARFL